MEKHQNLTGLKFLLENMSGPGSQTRVVLDSLPERGVNTCAHTEVTLQDGDPSDAKWMDAEPCGAG